MTYTLLRPPGSGVAATVIVAPRIPSPPGSLATRSGSEQMASSSKELPHSYSRGRWNDSPL
jgi:hypothetical protein